MCNCKCCVIYPKFKYVQEFLTTDIEQDLTIKQADIEPCGCISDGCVSDGKTLPNPFLDLHIQAWNLNTSGVYAGTWMLMDQFSAPGMRIYISPITGNITLYTGGTQGSYRIVILA